MDLQGVPVPGQADMGAVAVHAGRCHHMRLINRQDLRFVEGGGLAIIDIGIVLRVERRPLPGIDAPERDFMQHASLFATTPTPATDHETDHESKTSPGKLRTLICCDRPSAASHSSMLSRLIVALIRFSAAPELISKIAPG